MPERALAARWALAGFASTAIAAFAQAHAAPWAWPLLLPVGLSLFVAPARVPTPLQRALPYGARAWMAATALFALLASIYPIFADATITRASLLLGHGLALLTTVFLLGRRVWPQARTALPCAVGTLAAASLQPSADLTAFHATAVACLLAYAFATGETIEPPLHARRNRLRRAARLAVYAAVAGVLAVGIARFLPWAQPHVEEATARAMNPTYAVSEPAFSEHARLGSVEALALSHRVVLRMWSAQPIKLRGRVLVDFDGQTWHGVRTPLRPLAAADASTLPATLAAWLAEVPGTSFSAPAPALDFSRRARVVSVLELAGPLMTPAGTQLVRVDAAALTRDGFGIVQGPGGFVPRYAVVPGPQPDDALESAVPAAKYLAVPADTDPRLRALAAELGAGTRTHEERIARTVGYLGRALHYSLTPGKFHSRQPTAEFVFEKKEGYCEYFATAAAVLLRLQGVPTRYVSGFSPGDENRIAGHYVVRESDAHAWVEARLPGQGWVEVDPTPSAQLGAFRAAQADGWLARGWEWLSAAWAALAASLVFGGWARMWALATSPAVLAGVTLALLGVGFVVHRRRRPRGPVQPRHGLAADDAAHVPAEIAALLVALDAGWARHGHPRPAHRAPLEHARSLTAMTAEAQAASARAVDCFYAARFGRRAFPAEEVAQIRAELSRSLSAR